MGSCENLARLSAFACQCWQDPAPRTPTGPAAELRTFLLIAVISILMTITGCSPASAATRHIVLLFDERVELPGMALLEAEFVHTLRSNSPDPIEIYREAMDLSRLSSNSYKLLLRDFLRAKYADKKVDVAVAIMAPALDFLMAYGNRSFRRHQLCSAGWIEDSWVPAP